MTTKRIAAVAAALVLGGEAARAKEDGTGLGVESRASMSIANPAYAVGVAGMYAWRHLEVGGFLELNPWQNLEQMRTTMGSTNSGVVAHYVFGSHEDVRVRVGILPARTA